MTWADIKWFKSQEFDSPDSPGSGTKMDLEFVHKLDDLREAVKMPLTIHSGYRTQAQNDKVGGVDSSAHTIGHAADIGAPTSGDRFKIVEAALRIGFQRIGIGSSFIHLDDDLTKDQDVVWLYPPADKRTL